METVEETKEKISLSSYGARHVDITGLLPEESEKLQAAIRSGNHWIRVIEGRLISSPAFQELPDPVEDEEMLPFWQRVTQEQTFLDLKMFDEDRTRNSLPSIHIRHLAAVNYTPERYQKNARLLSSYGFGVMRSKRGTEGRYWETWYLPSLWSARGDLQARLVEIRDGAKKLDEALEFLRHRVEFGTLDVSVQRLAISLDDSV